MKYKFVPFAVVSIGLGLPSLAQSRPHEDIRTNGQESRGPHREGRDEPRRSNENKDGSRRPIEPQNVAQAPPVAVAPPLGQNEAARYQEHLKQHQDAARASRKDARKDPKAWNDGRSLRAESHRREVTQTLGNVTDRPDAKAELATHADRMARLNRALDVAEDKGDSGLVTRTNELIRRETARDAQAIAAVKASAGAP